MLTTPVSAQAELRSVFDLFDADKGGSIDHSELFGVMKALGFSVSRAEVTQMIENIDAVGARPGSQGATGSRTRHPDATGGDELCIWTLPAQDGSGTVDFEEFLGLVTGVAAQANPLEVRRQRPVSAARATVGRAGHSRHHALMLTPREPTAKGCMGTQSARLAELDAGREPTTQAHRAHTPPPLAWTRRSAERRLSSSRAAPRRPPSRSSTCSAWRTSRASR